MLLETHDIKSDDIVIYSKNKFDFHGNFKLIRKRDKIRRPEPITYFQVCEAIKSPTPKNLIAYRLLTSAANVNAFSSKYGFFIKVGDRMEVIYFDPVFALADLKYLNIMLDPERFRFKIQQVGFQTMYGSRSEPVFTEIYCFDLRADEAKNQNDKIFADAIFALDETYTGDEEYEFENNVSSVSFKESASVFDISEVQKVDDDPIIKKSDSLKLTSINIGGEKNPFVVRDEKINMLKTALGIKENEAVIFSINKTKEHDTAPADNRILSVDKTEGIRKDKLSRITREHSDSDKLEIMDLFRSTAKFGDSAKSRQKENFILKIKK